MLSVLLALLALLAGGCSDGLVAGEPMARPSALPTAASPTSKTAATSAGVTDRDVTRIVSMTTPDGLRTAIVHHPVTAVAGAKLLVVLHPAATTAAQMESFFGWDAIAERNHLVVVYPEGLLDGFQDTWNGGLCCAPANELGTDDVGFLHALVTALRGTDQVGPAVYAVGYSNGGILAYAWACRRPGELSGLGVVAGALLTECRAPGPLTVVAVHGTADLSIPISGGGSPSGFAIPALTESLAPFRAAARCPARPIVDSVGRATLTSWACAGGLRVISDVVTGLDHSWPGAGATAGRTVGPLDATGFLWEHLSAG